MLTKNILPQGIIQILRNVRQGLSSGVLVITNNRGYELV